MKLLRDFELPIIKDILINPQEFIIRGKPFISYSDLELLIHLVLPKLKSQPTICTLPKQFADTIIVGDIHGDTVSLLRITDQFLEGNIENLIFLGDYVDRGPNGLFVLVYLISLYLQFPKHIQLQKGNHEDLRMNKRFGFYDELKQHYSDEIIRTKVVQLIDKFYNVLSIGSITPNMSFLVHGGIPKTSYDLAIVKNIPKPYSDLMSKNLDQEKIMDNVLLEIQWNDPSEKIDDKFVPSWRGEGVYLFNEEALDEFLQVNNLRRVVRAHESSRGGYQNLFDGKLIHVFSSEPYFGKIKKAAVIKETVDGIQALDLNFESWVQES